MTKLELQFVKMFDDTTDFYFISIFVSVATPGVSKYRETTWGRARVVCPGSSLLQTE